MRFYYFSRNFSGFKLYGTVLFWQIEILSLPYMKLIQDAHSLGAKGVEIVLWLKSDYNLDCKNQT